MGVDRPRTFLADGAVREFAPLLAELGARSVFLVADSVAFAASGAKDILQTALADRKVCIFDGFRSNPQLPDVELGVKQYRAASPDLVVAVGGGSTIDMAKLIRWFAPQEGTPVDLLTGPPTGVLNCVFPPLLAIPTTAGTGSEATQFAVVYHEGSKHSVSDNSLIPDIALVDASLTCSQPAAVTAAAGLDALCQGIESIWSIRATKQSIALASESISLALQHLVAAVNQPSSTARLGMARAAHLSGQAINISQTTACHALSYTLTSRFDVPHGMAVALTLPRMMEFNHGVDTANCLDRRGPNAVRQRINQILMLLGCSDVQEAATQITHLMAQIRCPTRLRHAGVKTERDLTLLVDTVNLQRLANNPRQLSRDTALLLLESLR